jgi:hypothetical protein
MDSPRYLIEQCAAEKGISADMAKRALYLTGLSEQGRDLRYCADALGISATSVKLLCRRFIIDLADYRPYAKLEAKTGSRPSPRLNDIHKPASGLPLFA